MTELTHRIVLASSNPGKLREIQAMLSDWDVGVLCQGDLNVSDAEETGLCFVENAILKARNACVHTGLPALADDSGLAVTALGGQPGIYSARFAGKNTNDQKNLDHLLFAMRDVPDGRRQAAFVCALVFMRGPKDPTPVIAQALWHGEITRKSSGQGGFGYDPVFYLPDLGCTSAELAAEEKNKISHRGQALKLMRQQLAAVFA